MILILLGTQDNSFHRLLDKVQELIDKKVITEKVIVQAGRTKFESKDMEIYSLMPEEKLREIMEKADLVITHGGVGSIVMALKMGKKVIAVPRLIVATKPLPDAFSNTLISTSVAFLGNSNSVAIG